MRRRKRKRRGEKKRKHTRRKRSKRRVKRKRKHGRKRAQRRVPKWRWQDDLTAEMLMGKQPMPPHVERGMRGMIARGDLDVDPQHRGEDYPKR